MFSVSLLNFSRIGINRELKFLIENYWDFKVNFLDLEILKKNICYYNWKTQIHLGVNTLNVGDFSYYDLLLNNIIYINAYPKRFNFDLINIDNYFKLVRGDEYNPPMEMTKWFNTNYHYFVPEYTFNMEFKLNIDWILEEIKMSKLLKYPTKFSLIGPLTILKLGKIKDNVLKNKLILLPDIIYIYIKLLYKIKKTDDNIYYIQIEEPILILNISKIWLECFKISYILLTNYFSNLLLTTYFGKVKKEYLIIINNISFYGVHLDIFSYKYDLFYLKNIKIISLGIIDTKTIWKNNLELMFYKISKILDENKKFFISTNSSLLHIPFDVDYEKFIDKNIKNWVSFSVQKIKELKFLSNLIRYKNFYIKFFKLSNYFLKNIYSLYIKNISKIIINNNVQEELKNINLFDFKYREIYKIRKIKQNLFYNLPILPITTIGSFPQTSSIRKTRVEYKKNKINNYEYEKIIKENINYVINKQINYNINIFTNGEIERNDMVEYFSNYFHGFISTNYGWIQSYGTRCVKPPIIYGDIFLKKNIVFYWNKFINVNFKYLKGILTGPITMLKWSFYRNDQPNYITSIHLSLSIQKEVLDIEKNGMNIIQIDEPAIKEYLPLNIENYNLYFNWSIKVFLLSYNKVNILTQIHTHICYSEFKNILLYIIKLDMDVISIESTRSNMDILPYLYYFPNELGIGIYDIHSNITLNMCNVSYLIKLILIYIDKNKLWINPDCGLKTRKWSEIENSLINISKSSILIRKDLNY